MVAASSVSADGQRARACRSEQIDPRPVVCLEVPHPEILIDRLTEPQIQQYLGILPQYRKLLEGDQFQQLKAVVNMVAAQVGTTWDRGLRDLTGGGIVAVVEAGPGQQPCVYLLITPKDLPLLERAHQVLLKLARDDAKNKAKPDPVRTSEHKGVVVYAVGGEKGPAYAIISGTLAISNSAKNLMRLIDRHLEARSTGDPGGAGKARPALIPFTDQPEWKAIRKNQGADALAWGLRRSRPVEEARSQAVYTAGARGIPASFCCSVPGTRHSVKPTRSRGVSDGRPRNWAPALELPVSKQGRPATVKGYVPDGPHGNAPLLRPPGTIASLSLWRDWATIWESRADLFAPETVQGFAQLDTVAGQFFGGREFGPDVLGAFDPHWRLVVADQDYRELQVEPDPKIPAFAMVAELNAPDDDFASRLKIAFQSIVAISNVDAAQKKAPVMELGSEEVEGITIATTRFLVPRTSAPASEQALQRYNFTPAAGQVGKYFILSSSTGLARALVKELKAASGLRASGAEEKATFTVEADGPAVARFLERNRSRMVMQSMLKQGETKEKAEQRVGLYLELLRYLGHGRLVVRDDPDATRFQVKLELSRDEGARQVREKHFEDWEPVPAGPAP